MAEMNEIEAFLNEIAEESKGETPSRYINRERLDTKINEETGTSELFSGYIFEGYTEGIEGNYGESTAVRVIRPTDGRRMTLWLTGFEKEHFASAVSNWTQDGASFPMVVKFLRHKQMSKNGRQYNRFSAQLLNFGDSVTVPPVPEDQYEDVE